MMKEKKSFESVAEKLINAGRFLHHQGWVPATSGNFSGRLDDGSIAITVSGRHKGQLITDDIMRVDGDGRSLDGKKPSAETLLHTSLYKRDDAIGSVLHPHSPSATLISRLFNTEVVLEDYELLKAFPGITTHETRRVIPVFANDQNIARLAKVVDSYMDSHEGVIAYIIAGHGLYTWGASVDDALRHIEALEFMFDQEIKRYSMRKS